MAFQEVQRRFDGIRQNLAVHQKQAADGVGLWLERLPERTRRMAVNGINGVLGLSVIGVSYIVLDTFFHNPDLSRIPADLAPTFSQLFHLPIHDIAHTAQEVFQVTQNATTIASSDIAAAGNDALKVGIGLAGDGLLAGVRENINFSERQRRYGGPYLQVKDVIVGK